MIRPLTVRTWGFWDSGKAKKLWWAVIRVLPGRQMNHSGLQPDGCSGEHQNEANTVSLHGTLIEHTLLVPTSKKAYTSSTPSCALASTSTSGGATAPFCFLLSRQNLLVLPLWGVRNSGGESVLLFLPTLRRLPGGFTLHTLIAQPPTGFSVSAPPVSRGIYLFICFA